MPVVRRGVSDEEEADCTFQKRTHVVDITRDLFNIIR